MNFFARENQIPEYFRWTTLVGRMLLLKYRGAEGIGFSLRALCLSDEILLFCRKDVKETERLQFATLHALCLGGEMSVSQITPKMRFHLHLRSYFVVLP